MSLKSALDTVTPADFDFIYHHVRTHSPAHGNMQLRKTRTQDGVTGLRYLHALRVKPGDDRVLEGMISGPDIFWSYEIARTSAGTRVKVRRDIASLEERARLAKWFRTEILRRIASERATRGKKIRSNYRRGQFYLRRSLRPGMPIAHENCVAAFDQNVLHVDFLSQVLPWGFELLHP